MKLNKVLRSFDSYKPSFCCGAGALLALGAGSAVAGIVGSVYSNESNKGINRSQMAFNASEAEKQRQFQKDEWTRQYELQRDEWYNQLNSQSEQQWQNFLREAQYNSPENQVSRMAQAGLNPSAVLGQNGSSGLVAAATGNVHSSSSPSVPSGGSVAGQAASAGSQLPQQSPFDVASVGSFLRDLAQANKDTETVRPMVEFLGSQLMGQELQNSWQMLQNDIATMTKDTSVQKAFQELQSVALDNVLKVTMNENVTQDTILKATEAALNIAKEKLTVEQYNEVAFAVAHLSETYQLQMNLLRSQAANNFASANYSSALAATEKQIREFKVKNQELLNNYQDFVNETASNEAELSTKLKDARYQSTLRQLAEQANQSGILTKSYQTQLDMAVKENNWWLVNHLLLPLFGQFGIKLPHQIVGELPDKVVKSGVLE